MRTYFSFVIRLVLLLASFSLLLAPPAAHAETRITDGYLADGAVWTASSSPYILETGVTVPFGRTLIIESGVTITSDAPVASSPDDLPDISVNGELVMQGSLDKHIVVKGIWGVSIFNATATIAYTDFSTDTGLYLTNAHTMVSSSTISGAHRGIYVKSGGLRVLGSRIESNEYGVWVEKYTPIFQVMGSRSYVASADIRFGAPLAYGNDLPPAVVDISDSSFVGNRSAAIKNTETAPAGIIRAVGNWWGSVTGPASGDIDGPAIYVPWLDHDPTRVPDKPTCCSSILFLPGIESSRLYRDEKGILGTGIGFGTSTNMLWEPNRNDDVRKLFLNTDGSSADSRVYSGGAIDSAWGYGVYGGFMKFLDGLVAHGDMDEWSAFGYDWRKPIASVVLGSEKKATTTVSLMQTLTDMAARSKTGKVTLIAHSNGGLVAKYLTKALTDAGKDDLIDSIISVAVPYLGTPEAVGGILHGDDEELLGGLLLKQSVARQLGQNMPSAYSLLPSAKYFEAMSGATGKSTIPIILFSSTTPRSVNNGSYPTTISSFADEASFMTDAKNTRAAPPLTDVQAPLEANRSLMASAGALHDLLDTFVWPAHIARWAIVGWNALTTTGITYRASPKSGPQNPLPTHDAVKTDMGDGTVVSASAAYDVGTTTMIDLGALKANEGKETLHGDILESPTVQGVVKDMLEDSPAASKERAIASMPAVSLESPDYSKEKTMIIISTHSPIQPHIYDAQGDHTGEVAPPAGVEPGLFIAHEQGIPGSSFGVQYQNDTDYDTVIYVPDDGTKYSVVMNGTGVGSFTFDVDRIRGGAVLDHAEYADLPVTPLTVATTTIRFVPTDISAPPGEPLGIASSTFMADIRPLTVDVDGDGAPDIQAIQGSTTSQTAFWESMKKACRALFDTDKRTSLSARCKNVFSRIDCIEDEIQKGKFKKTHDFSDKITQYLKHRRAKALSDDDKREMGDMLDAFISQYE